MEINKKTKIGLSLVFIIIPVFHIIFLTFFSVDLRNELNNFISLFIEYFSMSINNKNLLVLSLLIEIVLFIFISIVLLNSKKNYILLFSSIILLFIIINIISLVFNLIPSYFYYAVPLAAVIFSLFSIFFMVTRLIRGSSFLTDKLKVFKPYFRRDCSLQAEIIKKNINNTALINNISLSGCRIKSEELLFFNEIVDIIFKIDDHTIKAKGKVVRKVYPIKIGNNENGIRFLKFEKPGKKILKDYLKKL
ncbi:MAG: PilZ domain-containing protein [Spirochaetes bacterium]|nr:PilZ domain-containing protein [Spirochaetota bacterium]